MTFFVIADKKVDEEVQGCNDTFSKEKYPPRFDPSLKSRKNVLFFVQKKL
jgi:hypothetical protein